MRQSGCCADFTQQLQQDFNPPLQGTDTASPHAILMPLPPERSSLTAGIKELIPPLPHAPHIRWGVSCRQTLVSSGCAAACREKPAR